MAKRIIKSHPDISSRKVSLIEKEMYLKQVARLQQELTINNTAIEQLKKALAPSNTAIEQLKKALAPSNTAIEQLTF